MSDKYNKEEESILQKIQNQTGCLLLVIGVAMLAFVLTDLLSSGTGIFSGRPSNSVGAIGGEEISYEEYQNLSETLIERARMNNPNIQLNDAMRESYKQQAWNSLVQEKLVQKEYDALGLYVGGAEMEDITIGPNTHSSLIQAFVNEEGKFDKSQLIKFLKEDMNASPERKEAWLIFEQDLVKQLLTEKYKAMISISYYVTDLEVKIANYEQQAARGVNVVGLNYATISDSSISVSDSEIEKYLNEHRKKYEQDASRDIEFVMFNVVASKQDTLDAKQGVTDRLEDFKNTKNDSLFVASNLSETPFTGEYLKRGDFSSDVEDDIFNADSGAVLGPYENSGIYSLFKISDIGEDSISSVKVSHILFRATNGDTAKALSEARSTLADIKSGKKDFAEVAKENNVDASKNLGGDLGWIREANYYAPENFVNEAKKTAVGGYFIVKTKNGVQLGKVTEAPTKKTVQVAQLSRSVLPGTETYRNYSTKAGELLAQVASSDLTFEEVAESLGYTKRVASKITEKERRISGVTNGNLVAGWLFDDDREEGDLSDIIEIDDSYFVGRVTKIRKKGLPDVEEMRSEIEPLVRNQKKAKELLPKVEEALKDNPDATALASALNTIVSPVPTLRFNEGTLAYVGQEEKLVGAAFGTPVGEHTPALEGKNGVYVIYVVTEEPVNDPQDVTQSKIQLRESKTQTLDAEIENELVELGEVVDKRYKFN